VVWAYRAKKLSPLITEHAMRLMNFMGSRVVEAGTGTKAQIPDREIAGKTGTANDYRDAWFIGYVPGLVAGVWVGNDDFTPMRKVTGGLMAAPIWHDFMVTALRDVPNKPLDLPREEDMPVVVDAASATDNIPALTPTGGAPARPIITPAPNRPPPPAPGGDG
jgi:penicillin-binding protein 1A